MRVWLELVDAAGLELVEGNLVEVRILPFAPREKLGFDSLLATPSLSSNGKALPYMEAMDNGI